MLADAPREAARRLTHASVGLLALLLRWLPWPAVIGCCIGGILLNWVLLPRVAPQIFRPGETRFVGVRAYPVAVLLIVLLFPLRIAAAAWAVLAFGDSMAALVGRAWGTAKLPWNREKSWQGLFAFVVAGTVAGALVFAFVEPGPPPTFGLFGEVYRVLDHPWWNVRMNGIAGGLRADVALAAFAAAAAAAVAESLPVRVDDNYRTAITAGIVFLLLDPTAKVLLPPA